MEKLVESPLPPTQQADQITELHELWKTLGDSHHDQRLWHRFQDASNRAYEPCKAHFREHKQKRKAHLEACKQMCNELEYFVNENDWNSADWKAVFKLILTAKQEWVELAKTDKANQRRLQPRFDHVIADLNGRLSEEQQRNAQLKSELIAKLDNLLVEEKDVSLLVQTTKNFQQDWRQIGITERRNDQKQWRQFRSLCDTVFERRISQSTQQEAKHKESAAEALRLCDEITKMARAESGDQPLSDGLLQKLRRQILDIQLQDEARKRVQKKLEDASREFKQALQQSKLTDMRNIFADLERRAILCHQLENLRGDISSSEQDRTAVIAQWQQDGSLPVDMDQSIQRRWRFAIESPSADFNEELLNINSDLARRICVKLEMVQNLASPEFDQPLRLALQVERLNSEWQGDRQTDLTLQDQLRQLVMEWFSVGPMSETSRHQFHARFVKAVSGFI